MAAGSCRCDAQGRDSEILGLEWLRPALAAFIRVDDDKAHGLLGAWEARDWPALTLAEVDAVLRGYPAAGRALKVVSHSPRPFSAASVVEAERGTVFVKRHHRSVRDRDGLLEEHRLMAHLATAAWAEDDSLVQAPLADESGETVQVVGEWVYEVHRQARGLDAYEQALSWTPFFSTEDTWATGRAMARMHAAARGYDAPARVAGRALVSSFSIFASDDPAGAMEAYLELRPALRQYAEARDWRSSMETLLMPLYERLRPWLASLEPLWTHNDFHPSNLMWSGAGEPAAVSAIVDFGLADRTNAVHDIATAIERSCIGWLGMNEGDSGETGSVLVQTEQLDGMLAGYESVRQLSYEDAQALAAMLPLVHCEFALAETDYFLAVLGDEAKARLAYEGYFLRHAEWFGSAAGEALLAQLQRFADRRQRGGA